MLVILSALTAANAGDSRVLCSKMFQGIELDFQTRESLVAQEADRAKKELREPQAVPASGLIVTKVYSITIDTADPSTYLLVVHDADGNEVIRRNGPDSIPDATTASGTTLWHDLFVTLVDPGVKYPITVHAMSQILDNNRCAATIQANGEATKLKEKE